MDGAENVLDTLFDEESIENEHDVEMIDVEEGEVIENISKVEYGEKCDPQENQECNMKNPRHKKKKKKNKQKRGNSSSGTNVTDINKFVLDVCKRLRERKSYLVYTAVGCLGISAFSDLVKEVDAIQACGGQKTADGKRFRNGGGILWNIIKLREPNAYKEIMRKGKEFEKQFKHPNEDKQERTPEIDISSQSIALDQANHNKPNLSNNLVHSSIDQRLQLEQPSAEEKRKSVHERIRVLVSYDDLLEGGEVLKDV